MNELQWSPEERTVLRDTLASESFAPVRKILDHAAAQANMAYAYQKDDHRYYQGKLHAVWEIINALNNLSQEEKRIEQEEERLARAFGTPISSSTDY